MGFLSTTKKKIITGVTTVKLMEDKPNILKDVVLSSVISKDNVASSIQQTLMTGVSSKVEEFYQYGKSRFTYGLPEGFVSNTQMSNTDVRIAIESEEGAAVILNNAFVSEINPDYIAYEYLLVNYDFDLTTLELATSPFSKPMIFDFALISGNEVEIHLYELVGETRTYSIFNIPLVYDATATYYQALYALTSNQSDIKVWFYNPVTNTHPALALEFVNYGSPFYPIIPLRTNKVNTTESGNADLIKTSNRALQKVGSSLSELTDAIMADAEENDPSVIDDVFFMVAVDVQTKTQAGLEYLYRFFNNLRTQSSVSKSEFEDSIINLGFASGALNYIDINDGEHKTTVVYNYIDYSVKTGVLSSKYESETILRDPITYLVDGNLSIVSLGEVQMSEIIFKRRISETQYEQVIVHGLTHYSDVYVDKTVERTLEDSLKEATDADPEVRGFYIPVSRDISRSMSPLKQSNLYMESLVIVVYTIQIQKIKWYQSKAFKVIVTIVAIILTVITVDFSGTWASIAASILTNIAYTVVVTAVLKELVKIVGGKLATLIAIIMVVIAIYNGGLSATDGLPWADDLLQLATLTLNAVTANIADDFLNLQQSTLEFMKSAREKEEELDELYLGLGKPIDYMTISRNNLYFDIRETPDQFFDRTIHETNPGVLSLDAIANYVEYKLRLPENNDFGMKEGYI